jgi:hypothetical protein
VRERCSAVDDAAGGFARLSWSLVRVGALRSGFFVSCVLRILCRVFGFQSSARSYPAQPC